jgi:hypothetical protein
MRLRPLLLAPLLLSTTLGLGGCASFRKMLTETPQLPREARQAVPVAQAAPTPQATPSPSKQTNGSSCADNDFVCQVQAKLQGLASQSQQMPVAPIATKQAPQTKTSPTELTPQSVVENETTALSPKNKCQAGPKSNYLQIGGVSVSVMNGCGQELVNFDKLNTPRPARRFEIPEGTTILNTECKDPWGRSLVYMDENKRVTGTMRSCIATTAGMVDGEMQNPYVTGELFAGHTAEVYKNPDTVDANAGCFVVTPQDLETLKDKVFPGMRVVGTTY